MAQFENNFVQDLQQDIKIRQCGTIVFNADNLSNVVSVELYNGEEAYSGGGTVVGAVVCPDGATVALDGTLSGNKASITLTGDCFALPGQIGVSIQIVSGDVRTTVLKAIYNVDVSSTDTIVDPDSRITLSLAEIEAKLDEVPTILASAQTAIDGIEAQKNTMIASIASVAGQGTDTTLTQSGVAADAKATGDQVRDLKGTLESSNLITSLLDGSIGESGNIDTSTPMLKHSNLIHVLPGVYTLMSTRPTTPSYILRIHEYTSGGTWVRQLYEFGVNVTDYRTQLVFDNETYIVVSTGGYVDGSVVAVVSLDSKLGLANDNTARVNALANENILDKYSIFNGFTIGADGVITSAYADGCITDYIPCTPGQVYTISCENIAKDYNVRTHAYTSQRVWNSQIGVINPQLLGTYKYTFTVPDGIYYLRISNGNKLYKVKLETGINVSALNKLIFNPTDALPGETFDNLITKTDETQKWFRGLIYLDTGNPLNNASVRISVYSYPYVVQDGGRRYVRLKSSNKYCYHVVMYRTNGTYIGTLTDGYISDSQISYVDGPVRFRLYIRKNDKSDLTDAEVSEIGTLIDTGYIHQPVMDTTPRYTLVGDAGVYTNSGVEYLVTANTSLNDIYALYDSAMAAYPNNITRETLGTAFDLPIYCYTFQPTLPKTWHHYGEQWNPTTFGNDPKMPMLLFNGGTHGDEKAGAYGLAYLMNQMWSDNAPDSLKFIRNNAVIKVVPVLNVSGFSDNTRANRNNVNLNRDFDGTFSQTESKLLRDLYLANKDYISVMIDFHQTPTRPSLWVEPRDKITPNVLRAITMPLQERWETEEPTLKNYSPRMEMWYFDTVGAIASWFVAQGVLATTCEGAWDTNGLKGIPSWGTNDLFTEKCNIEFYANTMIGLLKAVPNMPMSNYSRVKTIEITGQPEDTTVTAGSIASFSVNVEGYVIGYYWEVSTNDGSTFSFVENGYVAPGEENPYYPGWGAASNSNIWPMLRVQTTADMDGYVYHCIVRDTFGNRYVSQNAVLHVT